MTEKTGNGFSSISVSDKVREVIAMVQATGKTPSQKNASQTNIILDALFQAYPDAYKKVDAGEEPKKPEVVVETGKKGIQVPAWVHGFVAYYIGSSQSPLVNKAPFGAIVEEAVAEYFKPEVRKYKAMLKDKILNAGQLEIKLDDNETKTTDSEGKNSD